MIKLELFLISKGYKYFFGFRYPLGSFVCLMDMVDVLPPKKQAGTDTTQSSFINN